LSPKFEVEVEVGVGVESPVQKLETGNFTTTLELNLRLKL
jgi:hypothetical protein